MLALNDGHEHVHTWNDILALSCHERATSAIVVVASSVICNWIMFVCVCVIHTVIVFRVQGKGLVKTYWLHGKKGFNKPLPLQTWSVVIVEHN